MYLSESTQLACHLCQKLLKNHTIANLGQAHTSISTDFPHNTNWNFTKNCPNCYSKDCTNQVSLYSAELELTELTWTYVGASRSFTSYLFSKLCLLKNCFLIETFSMGAYFYYVDRQGGGGVRKMPILLNKMSTKGGRGVKKV